MKCICCGRPTVPPHRTCDPCYEIARRNLGLLVRLAIRPDTKRQAAR